MKEWNKPELMEINVYETAGGWPDGSEEEAFVQADGGSFTPSDALSS